MALSLVKFDPDDFSLGSLLGTQHGKEITNPNEVSSVLSLYFQWADQASLMGFVLENGRLIHSEMVCSYDEDERDPSELYLKCINLDPKIFKKYPTIKMRYELFNIAYSFECEILSFVEDPDVDFHFVVSPPNKLICEKMRRIPRFRLQSERFIQFKIATEPVEALLLEVSPQALVFQGKLAVPGETRIEIGGIEYCCRVSVRTETTIFQIIFETSEHTGSFFEFFSEIALPEITPRSKVPTNEALAAYERAGFIGKFFKGKTDDERRDAFREIESDWNEVNSVRGSLSEDYVAIGPDGKAIGASSLALSFYYNSLPVFTMQQLCIVSENQYFSHTRALYLWRCLYMMARPDSFYSAAWFDSTSKWLERIWVKFANHVEKHDYPLKAVQLRVFKFSRVNDEPSSPFSNLNFGSRKRTVAKAEKLLAGYGPNRLNCAGILNMVCTYPDLPSFELVKKTAEDICAVRGVETVEIRGCFSVENRDESVLAAPVHVSDRFCLLEKDELPFLLASMEHSIAVMRKKGERISTTA